jgi:5-aminopentanamidase
MLLYEEKQKWGIIMKNKKYQIGLVQAQFTNGEVEKNLAYMKQILVTTKKTSPELKLLLFPELAATGYFLTSDILGYAEGLNGSIMQYMSELAKENDVYIGYGYVELGNEGEIFNSFRLIDRHGGPIANYRKIHITEFERGIFTPGNEIVSVKTELGHIGLMICWDLAFPELARKLVTVEPGVDLILSPSAWEKPYGDPLMRFSMAKAIDNTFYVAVCNHVGPSGDFVFCGRTGLFGPDGASIVLAGEDDEQVLIAEIDFEYRSSIKSNFYTMLQERRSDLY